MTWHLISVCSERKSNIKSFFVRLVFFIVFWRFGNCSSYDKIDGNNRIMEVSHRRYDYWVLSITKRLNDTFFHLFILHIDNARRTMENNCYTLSKRCIFLKLYAERKIQIVTFLDLLKLYVYYKLIFNQILNSVRIFYASNIYRFD